MIISHKYKYLFIELPLTASTAVSKELRENYDGSWTLYKHATYQDFLRKATPEEKEYFVFSGIRNPLDQAVSEYFKCKADHKNKFTDPRKLSRKMGWYQEIVKQKDLQRFRFVQKQGATFADYFLKFYKLPYSNWSVMDHHQFDFVIRFESLQEDFAQLLKLLKIEQKRPLPQHNKTVQKNLKESWSHFDTPELIARARRVFGPFMQEWEYTFPESWGSVPISWSHQKEYDFVTTFRIFYWKYLRRRV